MGNTDNEEIIFDQNDPSGDGSGSFYFDDEPLERILYGKDQGGPSTANYFLPTRIQLQNLIIACREKQIPGVIAAASEFEWTNMPLSAEVCHWIINEFCHFFPYLPNPVMKHDLSSLHPLFEKLWKTAMDLKDEQLQINSGTQLFRWYEHQGKYEEARVVLYVLLEIYRKHGNRPNEGIILNNFAFEYLLEERWQEAIPIFEEAALIFKATNIVFEYANARANYWICRFAINDFGDLKNTEQELNEILYIVSKSGRWHERKPFILKAQIEERRGNISRAMRLVKKAIKSSANSGTRYPESDKMYLECLRKKWARGSINTLFPTRNV